MIDFPFENIIPDDDGMAVPAGKVWIPADILLDRKNWYIASALYQVFHPIGLLETSNNKFNMIGVSECFVLTGTDDIEDLPQYDFTMKDGDIFLEPVE
jgi:hypothetical protein